MKQPTPRKGVYELYWYFASERQAVFERRLNGEPRPRWTSDPILQNFKFCNTFRAADRVSQYLIRNVCYQTKNYQHEDLIFQIVAFRMFSNIATWRAIRQFLARSPVLPDLADGSFKKAVEFAAAQNGKLYTNAFILCAADAYGQGRKYLNHIALFKDMFLGGQLAGKVFGAKSLREIYNLLHAYPLLGDFMSYQIALDLNYSGIVNFSENDFTQAGPGALRGINKCFEDLGGYSPADVIMWMVDSQQKEMSRLGLKFDGLFGRPLHAIDCQGLFCETDKYCREAIPGLTSARKKIKSRFTQNSQPLKFFFPPKWEINQKIPPQMLAEAEA